MSRKTHFFKYHERHGNLVEFAGFEMSLWYEGINLEVLAVRNDAGVFDVSHMGRAVIQGAEAERYLDYLTTNNVSALDPGDGHYTVMCNEKGGVIDDLVILRIEENKFLTILNSSNKEKDLNWMNGHSENFDVEVEDVSENVAMMAVQGPKARSIIQTLSNGDLNLIKRFGCGELKIAGEDCLASGTGYTGEDGLEVFVLNSPIPSPEKALRVWNEILETGRKHGLKPCGLGARDTLRIEAGMCLYGHELKEDITPYQARIGFVVKMDKDREFIGRAALEEKRESFEMVRIGLRMAERGIPRTGYSIKSGEEKIGEVSSGTFSPTLQKGIGIGYVYKEYSKRGTILQVEIRGKPVDGEVVRFPFYDPSTYGWTRK